jgi:hypothetical protein
MKTIELTLKDYSRPKSSLHERKKSVGSIYQGGIFGASVDFDPLI